MAMFGSHVKIVQLKTSSPGIGDFHFAHRPAITICALSAIDCVGLLYLSLCIKLFPLVETVSDNETSLTTLPRIAKCGFGREFFRTRVEGRILKPVVFCPVGNQPPLHCLRYTLAINGSNGNEHRCSRRLIPILFKIRRDRVWRELQSYFDFRIVGG